MDQKAGDFRTNSFIAHSKSISDFVSDKRHRKIDDYRNYMKFFFRGFS